MINQQENEGLTESHHRLECEVYEDLSSLMQIFKKLLAGIEEMAFSHEKMMEAGGARERLRALSRRVEALVRKYSQQSGELRVEGRTFQRFVWRLFETIEIYQLKYRSSSSLEGTFAASSFASIEAELKDSDSLHDFLKLARTVRYIVEKFAAADPAVPAKSEAAQESPSGKRAALDKIEAKMIKIRNLKRARPEREERWSSEEEEEYDEVRSVSFAEKKTGSLPISHSISSDLQKRFDLYKGLELDFSNFKASYFTAKTTTDLFYRDCLDRNGLTARIIKGYSDDFLLFQKKRLKNHRRMPSKPSGAPLEGGLSEKVSEGLNSTKSEQLSLKEDRSDRKGRVAVIHSEKLEEEGADERDRTKTSFKMNSIYLTFGKKAPKAGKNERRYPNITPNLLKSKHEFQNLYLNHSKNELSVTQSIDFDHSQLKVFSGVKGSQRIKTSPDKGGISESQKVKGEYREAVMRAFKEVEQVPFRAANKRRYLEVDCTSKKEISLNKVILTGSTHARHIKLGKINEPRANNILF